MASVGEHSSRCIRDNPCSLYHREQGRLPQITRIYTDVGAKDVEKICENPWHLWENIAQDASVIIRVRFIIGSKGVSHWLRGSTRMRVRRMLKKSVRLCGICGRTSSQAASVIIRVRFIIGCEGVSHWLRRSTRMWVRRMLKKSVIICGIYGRTSSQAASVIIRVRLIIGCEGVSHWLRSKFAEESN